MTGNHSDPEATLRWSETWSGHATLAILAGIVIEIFVILGWVPYSPAFDKSFSIAADVLIGIGLVTEYVCIRQAITASGELKVQSDAKLAEALTRAASAERELIKFRQPRRNLLTAEAKAAIADKLKPFGGTPFDIGFGEGDGEQADCAWDIEDVLAAAHWNQLPWGVHAVGVAAIHRNLRPLAGSVGAQNIELQVEPTWRQARLAALKACIDALKSVGIEARDAPYNTASTNVQAIHVLIGPKR